MEGHRIIPQLRPGEYLQSFSKNLDAASLLGEESFQTSIWGLRSSGSGKKRRSTRSTLWSNDKGQKDGWYSSTIPFWGRPRISLRIHRRKWSSSGAFFRKRRSTESRTNPGFAGSSLAFYNKWPQTGWESQTYERFRRHFQGLKT